MATAATVLGLLIAYLAVAAAVNRSARPRSGVLDIQRGAPADAAPRCEGDDTLSLAIWNLGYAGLGADAEFFADGGRSVRPVSKAVVEQNLAGVLQSLPEIEADIMLFQEVAERGALNFNVDMLAALSRALPAKDRVFTEDLRLSLVPFPLALRHGLAAFSKGRIAEARASPLPLEPRFFFGVIRKLYALQILRVPMRAGNASWVIIHLHLSAFDEGGVTRFDQLKAALELARMEFERGNFVVLGGDWNLEFASNLFPHATEPRHLSWVRSLPRELLPEGWGVAFDPSIATVRSNNAPYREGVNYTGVIDGFIASPNVEITQVRGVDLRFRHSDHQPVVASFRPV